VLLGTDEALEKWDERYSRTLERVMRRSFHFDAEPRRLSKSPSDWACSANGFIRSSRSPSRSAGVLLAERGLALDKHKIEQGFYEKIQTDAATLVASAPLPDGRMHLWTVLRVALVPDTDLAVLSMALTSAYPVDRRFVSAALTTRMPALGELLTITGLSAVRGTEAITNNLSFQMIPGCAFGQVIDRYPEGRGRMMPGPCVAVECHARGGMSGGPVFDSRGYLVGIVSSSFDGMESTFVSHIWPALVRPLGACPVWPPPPYPLPAPGSLLQLGRKFGIDIERPDAFKLCAPYGEIALRYEVWE